jgi:hypothetical protein
VLKEGRLQLRSHYVIAMVLGSAVMNSQTCDGTPLSAIAKKVPLPKRFKSKGSTVNHACLDQQMMIHIVDKLWKAPKYIKDMHAILYSHEYPMPAASVQSGLSFDNAEVKSIAKCPDDFLAQRLKTVYGAHGLTDAILNAIGSDKDNLHILTAMDLQLSPTAAFPKEIHNDEALCHAIMDARRAQVGSLRVKGLIEGGGLTAAGINVSKGGCFSIEFGTEDSFNIGLNIVHNPTGTKISIPAHSPITREFDLIDNYVDNLARVAFQGCKLRNYSCIDFFNKDDHDFVLLTIVPKKGGLLGPFVGPATKARKSVAEQQQNADIARAASALILNDAKKKKTEERTKKTKEIIAVKAEERALKRKFRAG